MSYGIVGFKLHRKPVVYFGYWKAHYALYGMGRRVTDAHAAELKNYLLSKGTAPPAAEESLGRTNPYQIQRGVSGVFWFETPVGSGHRPGCAVAAALATAPN